MMGTYLNPGNIGFKEILQSEYVDKTGLISLINSTIGTRQKLTCVSRPRRFGKSYAAQMLCAYYDKTCNSEEMFKNHKIAEDETFYEHLNKYNVVYLDITGFITDAEKEGLSIKDVPAKIVRELLHTLKEKYPELSETNSLNECMLKVVEIENLKFIFIIDEWDAIIREAENDENVQKQYLNLLRGWFKNGNFTPKAVAAAYMTGILPIKKNKSQSALSDFWEYTILDPGEFTEYTGFTEEEVKKLCGEYKMDFEGAREWYDGYCFSGYGSIYNPYSVMSAMKNKKYRSYWRKTSASEALITYINMDFEGIQEIVSRLISGEEIEVDTNYFENDFQTFKSLDDVLTLLIHLGYLSYNDDEGTVRIPNEEIHTEFNGILRGVGVNDKWMRLITRSKKLLADTIAGDGEAVVRAIEEIRDTEYAPTFYNNEQALRYVIKFAYIAAVDQYLKVEELPSGHGIADVVYIPKKRSLKPALVIELKWNRSAGYAPKVAGAIEQIKDRNYPAVIEKFLDTRDGEENIVLVGINYDSRTKEHSSVIERYG